MPVTHLTTAFLSNGLHCPTGKRRIEYVSDDRSGLYIEVRSTSPGQGTWYLRYKNDAGKTCHAKLGRTTDLELPDARKAARTLKAHIQLGADPSGDAKARKAVPTLNDFFESQYLPYAKPRKRTWDKDAEYYRLRLRQAFGTKRLDQITRQQIQAFHTRLRSQGLAAASCNHYLKLMKQMLNLALRWDIIPANPAVGIPMFKEENLVENYLNNDELKRLLMVLQSDENRAVCRIALFLLSTGARLNEVLRATWDQIDRETGIWRIPASNSKSRKVRAVPLNASALEVLGQLDSGTSFLFASGRSGKPYTTITKVWDRLRKKAGLPHLRIHDLRHQYASFLVNSGRTLYEVQQILGHSNPTVTQRYAHLSVDSLKGAADSASERIKEAS